MRRIAIVLALLLLAPLSAAGSSTFADATGDVELRPAATPLAAAGCADDAIDLTGLTVGSDGTTLTVTLAAVDLAAPFACGGVALSSPQAVRRWVVDVQAGPDAPLAQLSVFQSGAVVMSCTAFTWSSGGGGPSTRGDRACDPIAAPTGSTLAWSLPLAGTRAGGDYDLRGVETWVGAQATQTLGLGVLVAADAIPAGAIAAL